MSPLPDRRAVLAATARLIAEAWESFDRPRPVEPGLDAALLEHLAAPLPETGEEVEEVLRDAAGILDGSVSPARPLYVAYVGSTATSVGAMGAALAATYDVNLATHAAAADLVERQALGWTGELIGYRHAEGAFTSGGMVSNLSALLAARERALPGSRREGVAGRAAAVYASAEGHHSVLRAVEVAGLGTAALRVLPIDDDRRLVPDALEEALERDRAAGVVPVAVVATAGTTLTGAVDPIAAVADVCERHGTWLHVDGAYGLPAAAAPSAARLFDGLARADSVTLDAHKWLGVPKSCSVVLVRHAGALGAAFGHRETYMLGGEDRTHAVETTLEYSRPFRSLKLWLALRALGAAEYRSGIERTLGHARALVALVEADPAFELLNRPQLSTVCFRHRPAGKPAADLDAHNLLLARAMQEDGRVYLAPALVDGRTCLRACFVNFRTKAEQVAVILDVARELGARA